MDRSTAKRFEDLGAARGWIAETFAEWEADLTDAERVALNEYKRTGHRDINEALRLGDLEGSSVEGLVQALDVALSRMRLPEPVITWRGSIEHDLYAALETLPGDIIEDAGFVSASLLRRIAEASPARRHTTPFWRRSRSPAAPQPAPSRPPPISSPISVRPKSCCRATPSSSSPARNVNPSPSYIWR